MTNRFLISVAAAALIAGTGFANAQGMNREGGAAGGAATQQSAPSSERAAPSGAMNHDSGGMKGAESSGTKGSEKSGMKAESNEKMPSSKSAQDTKSDTKGGKDMKAEGRDSKSGTTAAEGRDSKSGTTAAEGRDSKSGTTAAEGRDSKSGTTAAEGRDSKSGTTAAEGRDQKSGNMNAQTKGTTDSKSTTTTGNAATSATAAPPPEKRTQIVSAIKSERIEETTNVNFNVSVGATIPSTVRFHPLPPRIVEIYPEWRGYDVVFVKGRYIIVRPETHEIVYIIEG